MLKYLAWLMNYVCVMLLIADMSLDAHRVGRAGISLASSNKIVAAALLINSSINSGSMGNDYDSHFECLRVMK